MNEIVQGFFDEIEKDAGAREVIKSLIPLKKAKIFLKRRGRKLIRKATKPIESRLRRVAGQEARKVIVPTAIGGGTALGIGAGMFGYGVGARRSRK